MALVNWALDPFGRFGRPTQGYYFEAERSIKHGLVRHHDSEGLLMGSSKVAEWQPRLIENRRVLNAAWSAALPEEMYYFLRDVEPSVDFIAIGFDMFMFNESVHAMVTESEFQWFHPPSWSTHLLSLSMLERGLSARDRLLARSRPAVLPDGARNTYPDEADDSHQPRDNREVLERLQRRILVGYRFAEPRVDYLHRIRDWGERNCVVIVAFANPMSEAVLALLGQMQLQDDLARFRSAVRAAFPDILDLSVGELAAERFYWRRDPDHYYPSVGTRIFNDYIEPLLRRKLDTRTCTP